MQTYLIKTEPHSTGLGQAQRKLDAPVGHEVHVRVHAVALNFRDLMLAEDQYRGANVSPVIPCSDGAGEVIAIGPQVTRFKVGDRVVSAFFADWISGAPTPQNTANTLGGAVDGLLAQEVVLHEQTLVAIPAHLSWIEAATLPCAAVTAWNALFVEGRLKAGDNVLLLGTGGVSIWALQLAKAAGVHVIMTSSSDEKLQRARSLGANATVNYKHTPEWQDEVLGLTGGRGVDLVLEVGGQGTLSRSMASARMGGTVAIIGGVSGFGGEINPVTLIGSAKRIAGILVGSRDMLEALSSFVSENAIHPVIDRVFSFDQAREAYAYLKSGSHFGKVVIEVQ
mgnify:CR=1 FL=1